MIVHADNAHFIHKSEESNATTAGGYSAKWLPTGTTEMEARRHVCVLAGKSNRPGGKKALLSSHYTYTHIYILSIII